MSDTAVFSHEDMIRKVAALLATAEDFAEQGNDDAAQAYVQKAHTLQQKYSIDQAMIEEKTGVKTEKIISKDLRMPGKYGKKKVTLAHVIAHRTNCTGYFHRMQPKITNELDPNFGKTDWDAPKDYYYTVFGFESDVEHVEFMLNSLAAQMDSAYVVALPMKPAWEHGKSFGASFMDGFINTIGSRLSAAQREAEKNAATQYDSGSTSTSLVLVDRKKRVEAEMRAQVGGLGKGSASRSTSGSGYAAGRAAGNKATIARGAVGNSPRGSLGR